MKKMDMKMSGGKKSTGKAVSLGKKDAGFGSKLGKTKGGMAAEGPASCKR